MADLPGGPGDPPSAVELYDVLVDLADAKRSKKGKGGGRARELSRCWNRIYGFLDRPRPIATGHDDPVET